MRSRSVLIIIIILAIAICPSYLYMAVQGQSLPLGDQIPSGETMPSSNAAHGPSFQMIDYSTPDIYNVSVKVREGYSRYMTVNCTESSLDAFQRALGLPSDYTGRFVNRLKLAAISKLIQLHTTTLLNETANNARSADFNSVQTIVLEDDNTETDTTGCTSITAAGKVHCPIDQTEAAVGSAARQLQTQSLRPEVPSGGIRHTTMGNPKALAKFLEAVVVNSVVDGIDSAGLAVESDLRQNRRRLSMVDQLFGEFMTANTESDVKLPTVSDIQADLRFDKFLGSQFVGELVHSLIAKVILSGTISVKIDTPSRNLGRAVCQSSIVSNKRDGELSNTYICSVLSVMATMEVCSTETKDIQCDPSAGVPTDMCDMDPRPEQQQQHIPLVYLNKTELSFEEGNTDYWLFRSTRALSHHANYQAPCNLKINPNTLIPGWTPRIHMWVGGLNATDETPINQTALPLAIVSESDQDLCHFLVTIRGSISEFDWLIDISDKLHEFHDGDDTLRVHGGFYSIAAPLNIILMTYLQTKRQECFNQCTDSTHNCPLTVTLTGHSMGGGVAHVLALLMTAYMPQSNLRLTAFGSPHSLDARSTSRLNQRALVRNWQSEFDPVPYMPCTVPEGTTLSCEASKEQQQGRPVGSTPFIVSGFGMTTNDKAEDGVDTNTMDSHYANNPNIRMIESSVLGILNPKFAEKSFGEIKYDLLTHELDLSQFKRPAPIQFEEYHSCSYACYLSTQYCFQSAAWLCDC